MKYRKKPAVIDAVEWNGKNIQEVMGFMNWRNASHDDRQGLIIHTLEGSLSASIGDMIIKGVKGEFYACKPDIFAATYGDASALAAPQQEPEATLEQIEALDDLVTMVRRLVHALHKAAPTAPLPALAVDYLERKGFNKGPFRDVGNMPLPAAPALSDGEIALIYGEATNQMLREQDRNLVYKFARALLAKAKP